jgi:TolB-like protein
MLSGNIERAESPSRISSDPEVKAQLARILASREFDVPDRARKFLQYLVEETLAGRANRIKAYSIAIEVFGRDETFDAQNDPVVRIEAGRIRRALERYYLVGGNADPILISIPKGGYIPVFEQQVRTPLSNTHRNLPTISSTGGGFNWRLVGVLLAAGVLVVAAMVTVVEPLRRGVGDTGYPQVAVTPFSNMGSDGPSEAYAFGLTAEVIHQLAKFKDLVVIAERPPGERADRKTVGRSADRFELTGSVRTSGEQLRIVVQLVQDGSNQVLWTEAYDGELRVETMLDLQKDIAQKVVTAIGQPYGIVFRADASQIGERPPDDFGAYSCTLAYFAYRAEYQPQRHAEVRSCLERTVVRFPNYATAWALLSLIYLDEERFEYNVVPEPPSALARALVAARRATTLDPNNIRALHALMLASFFNQDVQMGLAIAKQALEINPNDMELVGEIGVRTALSGDWVGGVAMIERALGNNPSNSTYYYSVLALAAYMQRDFGQAVDLITRAKVEVNGLYCLIAAAIYGQAGMLEKAGLAKESYFATGTNYLDNLEAELTKRNLRKADQILFMEGLRKAGFQVPAG